MLDKTVIIMLFLTTAVVSEGCVGDPCDLQEYCYTEGSFAPSQDDCYAYLWCYHGTWNLENCTDELWFNHEICACDHKDNWPGCVICPTTTPKPSLEPGTCVPVPDPCTTPGERYADQSTCEYFYECQSDGSLLRVKCEVEMDKCQTSGLPCLYDIYYSECTNEYLDCDFRCPGTTITTVVSREATSMLFGSTQHDTSTGHSTITYFDVTTASETTTTQPKTTSDDETTFIPHTTPVSTLQSTVETSPDIPSTVEETSTHMDTTQITTDHESTYFEDTTPVTTLLTTSDTYTSDHQSTETSTYMDTTQTTTDYDTTYRTGTVPVSTWPSTSDSYTLTNTQSMTEEKSTHMDTTTQGITTVTEDTTSNIETSVPITTHPQTKSASTEDTSLPLSPADTTVVTSQPTTESHRETTAYSSSTGHTSSQRTETSDQTEPNTEPTTHFVDISTPSNVGLEVWQVVTLVAMSAAGAGILMGICYFAILAWNREAKEPCTDGDVSSLSSCDDRRKILESSQQDDAILFKPALFRSSSQWSESGLGQPPPFGRSMSIDSSQWRFSEEGMDTVKIRDKVSLVQNPVYYMGEKDNISVNIHTNEQCNNNT